MKLFKRMISLLLVLCFLGVCLVACGKKPTGDETDAGSEGNNENKVTETETNVYGEPSFTTALPVNDLDFEGEELTVLLRNNEVTLREWYKESPEDELDEAVAMRNAAVEETLNVKLDYEIFNYGEWNASTALVNSMIVDDVTQDLHYYDIAVHWALAGGYASIRDCNANLLDKETFPYFEFSLPCWNQSIVDTTVIIIHKKTGAQVAKGDVLATMYTTKPELFDAAVKRYQEAVVIADTAPEKQPLIYARITKEGVEKLA